MLKSLDISLLECRYIFVQQIDLNKGNMSKPLISGQLGVIIEFLYSVVYYVKDLKVNTTKQIFFGFRPGLT